MTKTRLPLLRAAAVLILAAACAHTVAYQTSGGARAPGGLTLDDIYHPDKKKDFTAKPASGFVWLDDATYLWPKKDEDGKADWQKVDAATGRMTAFDGTAAVVAAFAKTVDDADVARTLAHSDPEVFARESKTMVATRAGDVYRYTLGADRAVQVTKTPAKEEEAFLSPDGQWVAFVRDNDLYVASGDPAVEKRITTDGGENVLNGKLDWIYQEEIYGRGTYRAHWWSPDSKHVAFLRLDEHAVPRFTLVNDIPSAIEVETTPYPRPGEPNPTAKIGIASVEDGSVRWLYDSAMDAHEPLVVDVHWRPDGTCFFGVQDREQRWFELRAIDSATGAVTTLLREESERFVNRPPSPEWLADGSFLWVSERTGFAHVEHVSKDGQTRRAITKGEWEVRTLHGIDPAEQWIYFSGTERTNLSADVYRVKLDGSSLTRLSKQEGAHSAKFSPGFAYFLDTHSDVFTPPKVDLCRGDGVHVRTVDENKALALDGLTRSRPEFVKVPARDGVMLDAMIVKPIGFDPSRRYPVFQHTYAGPHAQQVTNAWGGTNGMFLQLLAQRGILVWVCDNRTSSGKGTRSEWPAYLRLGESELQDIEDGVDWLVAQGWADPARIGISGWSYGGFMASYALTHSTKFAMGIAGGSVTDWRNYDSIYTERYMRTPKNNPDGYARTSVISAADKLSGRLLLIHGSIDDNVHPQNTWQLVDALQKADKTFELMIYPQARHGVTKGHQVLHLRKTMLDFIERTLLATEAGGA